MNLLEARVRPHPDHLKHSPLTVDEIDALPPELRGKVWATLVEIRKSLNEKADKDYPDGHEPGIYV